MQLEIIAAMGAPGWIGNLLHKGWVLFPKIEFIIWLAINDRNFGWERPNSQNTLLNQSIY